MSPVIATDKPRPSVFSLSWAFLRQPFARRVMVWTGLLIALLWTLLGIDIWRLHQQRVDGAQAQAASVVHALSERVLRSFRIIDHALQTIEQELSDHAYSEDVSAMAPHLRRHAPRMDEILSVAFDDATGRCIVQSNPSVPTGRNHADSEYFRAHVADPSLGLYIEAPKIEPGSGQRLLTVSRRVADRNGKFLGTVSAAIRADVLAAAFDSARIGPRGSVGLIHVDSRRIIARQPDYEQTFGTVLQKRLFLTDPTRPQSGRFEDFSGLDGHRRHFTYGRIEGLPLAVAAGISLEDIDAQLARDLGGYFLLAVMFSFIAAAGGFLIVASHRRELELQANLAEKEAMIGAFFEASPVGMYMLDAELNYRLINPALANINAVSIEDSLGRSTRDVVPALAAQLEPVYGQIVATGEPQKDVEITDDGLGNPRSARHWLMSNFPILDSGERWLGIGGIVVDVTERRLAECALRRWQDIFEHAEWGVAVCGADGKTLQLMNPAYARMHGRGMEDLAAQPVDAVYAPESIADIARNMALSDAQGHCRFESLHLHRDGHVFPVLVDATTVRNDAGEILYRIINVQDITAIRQAQEEVRIAKEFFENIFDVSPVGKAIADLDGHYVKVNRAMCEFVGYPERELLTMSFQDITHADDLKQNLDLRDRMLAGEFDVFRMEKRFVHKDGRTIWALLVVTQVRDSQHRPIYTIGQMLDIDQRKRAEEALIQKDSELREALRVGKIGSWDLDAVSRRVTWSEQLCRIVGRDPAQPVPENAEIRKCYAPESLVRHRSAIERAIASGESYELEIEVVLAGGQPGWLLVCGEAVRDAAGKVIRLRGTAQDITERKNWEVALEHTRERLRALSTYQETMLEEERKRIAREVHDELGQFLTALKMDISLVRLRFGDDPELREKVEDMRILVEQTIEVVRHVASNLRPAALDLGLVPAIEWLAEDFGHRWELACRVDLSGGEITVDDVRATAVFRVVQESLTNIARHAAASEVTISLEGCSDRLLLRVRDNGRGFDPATVARTRGFGLLGMRERMLALGGTLSIDSAPGAGTAVVICLPKRDEGA